jgi:hypothetical protein
MAAQPKPGDPDFTPRYPPFDLAPFEKRIEERELYASGRTDNVAVTIRADTEMMVELVREVKRQQITIKVLKGERLDLPAPSTEPDGLPFK